MSVAHLRNSLAALILAAVWPTGCTEVQTVACTDERCSAACLNDGHPGGACVGESCRCDAAADADVDVDGDTDVDGDSDIDGDTDVDGDVDVDVDGDTDVDGDADGASDSDVVEPECRAHTDCGGAEVCASGECRPPWGLRYRVVAAHALGIPPTRDEVAWDPPEGLPDPYLLFWIDRGGAEAEPTGRTPAVEDVTDVEWYWSGPRLGVVIDEGATLEWALFDDDEGDGDELIASVMDDATPPRIELGWIRDGIRFGRVGELEVLFLFVPF